jgi:hypothetical protein
MREKVRVCLFAVLGGLLLIQAVVWVSFLRDQRYLAQLMNSIASPNLPPSSQAEALLAYLREKPPQTNRSFFLHPAFRFLRASAREVSVGGGNCADRSRFVVVMLELHGIHASKWALYSPDLRPAHAVVELDSEQGKMVVDPLYGLWFPRSGGGYYSISDLQQDPDILIVRLRELRELQAQPGAEPLERYPLNRYIYSHSRTINWDKSVATHDLYAILHSMLGERVNKLSRPEWAEQPAIMLLLLISGIEVALLGIIFLGFITNRTRPPLYSKICRTLGRQIMVFLYSCDGNFSGRTLTPCALI